MTDIPFDHLVGRCRDLLAAAGDDAGPTVAVPIGDFRDLVAAVDPTDGPSTGVYRGQPIEELSQEVLIEAFGEVRRCAKVSADCYERDIRILQAERERRILAAGGSLEEPGA